MGGRVTTQNSPASPPPRIGIDALTLRPMMSGVCQAIHNLLNCLPQAAPEFDYLVYHSHPLDVPHMHMKHARPATQFQQPKEG